MKTRSHLIRDLDDLARLEEILRHAKTFDLRWAINELENWTVELEESIEEHGKIDKKEVEIQVLRRQPDTNQATRGTGERKHNFRVLKLFA